MNQPSLRVQRVVAPIREQVYAQLKRAIVDMYFVPGQRLIERELTEMTGVSRPTLREALQQLTAEGLVTTTPGTGWVVATLTHDEAADLYEIRARLEGLAARRFVERATADDLVALKESFGRVKKVLSADTNVSARLDAKTEFYEVLFSGMRSQTIESLISGLHARISVVRARTLSHPGRAQETIAEIRGIIEAIDARDADLAEQRSVDHVRNAAAVFLDDADRHGAEGEAFSQALPAGGATRA